MPSLNIYIDNEGSDHCNQKHPKKREKNNLIGLSFFFCNALLKITKKKSFNCLPYSHIFFRQILDRNH